MAFSPDGAFLVAGADYEKDRAARVFRVSDGAKVAEIKDKLRVIGRAAVSADARFIATEGDDPNWSPPTDGPMTESAYARTFKIHLWSAQTRELLFTYNGYYSLSGGAQLLQFSPDGKFLFSAGSDGGLRRLEIATKSVLEIPPTPKSSQSPLDWPIALAPDTRRGAGVTRSEAITTFDTTTQKLGAPFASPLSNPDKVWWSPDGRYLFGDGFLFDVRTGELLAAGARAGEIFDVVWKNDELWTSSFERVTRWKIPSLEKIDEWRIGSPNYPGYTKGVRLSPDARFVLTVEPESSGLRKPGVWVWDAVTHELLRTIMPDFGPFNSDLSRLRFFPRGDKVLRPTKNGLELWDLTTGEKLQTWHDPIDPKFEVNDFGGVAALFALAVSPDEKLIAARAARDSSIWIFDLKNPNSPLQLLIKAGYNAQFLSDSRTLLAQTGEEKWQEWDARGDGRAPLRKLGTIGRQLQLSPDDKLAAVTSPFFGGLKIWDRTRDAEAARIYLADASRFSSPENPARPGWIALTPQGFYNASPSAEKYLRWRDEHELWLLQKSRAEFFRPDKVRAALQPR
jgi:WD40 repeat protein